MHAVRPPSVGQAILPVRRQWDRQSCLSAVSGTGNPACPPSVGRASVPRRVLGRSIPSRARSTSDAPCPADSATPRQPSSPGSVNRTCSRVLRPMDRSAHIPAAARLFPPPRRGLWGRGRPFARTQTSSAPSRRPDSRTRRPISRRAGHAPSPQPAPKVPPRARVPCSCGLWASVIAPVIRQRYSADVPAPGRETLGLRRLSTLRPPRTPARKSARPRRRPW